MNITEIKSTQNDFIKYCVKLQNAKFRKSEKLILVDGNKTIEGFINDNIEFEYFLTLNEDNLSKKAKIKNLILVNEQIIKKISTLNHPTNYIGIIKEPEIKKEIFFNLNKIALIENIKDPGNLGTIIRSAAAFSMDGIILFGDCVDLYNPKTIRSTAQNIFKLPIISIKDMEFIKKIKITHAFYATVVNYAKNFFEHDFKNKFILMFGSEADGLSKELINLSDEKLTINMDNNVESINLGVCASILFSAIKYKK